jgi:YtcA family
MRSMLSRKITGDGFGQDACGVRIGAAAVCTIALSGCDPIVTIAGANFPSWLLCMIVGAIIVALIRPLLVFARLEPHLGPLVIFYPSLIAMFAMTIWIIFFNRV